MRFGAIPRGVTCRALGTGTVRSGTGSLKRKMPLEEFRLRTENKTNFGGPACHLAVGERWPICGTLHSLIALRGLRPRAES